MFIDMSKRIRKVKSELDQIRKIPKDQTTAELEEQVAFNERKLINVACRQLPEFKELSASNRVIFISRLSTAEQEKLIEKTHATMRSALKRWHRLQKQPAWQQLLDEKNLKIQDAHDFLVSRPADQGFDEYRAELAELDSAGGTAVTLFTEWFENWPQAFDNALEYRSRFKTEINYRLSYALASIAFAVIGIPLGIRAHRSEKTIGFLICLGLIAVHYAMVILVYQFKEVYTIYPYLLIWVPDLLFIISGLFMMWRNHHYS